MIAPQSAARNDSPGAGKNQRDYWARNHFRPERCLPASRLPVGGFAMRHLMAKVMRGSMLQRRTSRLPQARLNVVPNQIITGALAKTIVFTY